MRKGMEVFSPIAQQCRLLLNSLNALQPVMSGMAIAREPLATLRKHAMRKRSPPSQRSETLLQAGVALPTRRRGSTPELPHERDESPSIKVPPDPAVAQAHRDLESGQQDTDRYKDARRMFERGRARKPR
jgi:hypothetical protein